MRRPLLINADDLEQWSDRYEAAAKLPLLVRRLVLATRGIASVSFRTAAGVRLAGWDGFCEGTEPHPFVAVGPIGWELSVQKEGIAAKATEDFNKRAADANASQITFIFLTSRRWGGRHAWTADRVAEAKFRAVRVIDADDLEAWLEHTPAVHLWWTRELGKHPDGAVDVETYWNEWSQVTVPPLSLDFVLAGRNQAAAGFRQWLESSASSIAVVGPSQEEALAFVAAAIHTQPEPVREVLAATAVIVSTQESFNDLVGSPLPLLLVPLFDDAVAFGRAVKRSHRLIVPIGGALIGPGRSIPLDRVDPSGASDALVASGVGRDRAWQLAQQARRNFAAFRREITPYPTASLPEWASSEVASGLLPLWMAGGWLESSEADVAAISTLTGEDGAAVLKRATRWLDTADPPLRREGQFWYFTAKREGVVLLGRYATLADLGRFEDVVMQVLGELDPRYTVDKEERWANLSRPRHSAQLATGLAETLAAMAGLGQQVRVSALTLPDWSARAVRRLFELASADWRLWASLSPQLPLLAEAAPRQFLDAVEASLRSDQHVLDLFKQSADGLFGSSPHTGLLWALEGLAWSEDWVGRAASLLADLAHLDPGGKTANRPRESLRRVFLVWYPQNTLPWKEQLSILDSMLRLKEDTGWRIVSDLLPRSMDNSLPLHKPKFRPWPPEDEPQLTRRDVWQRQRDIVELLLQFVGLSGTRWENLIESLGNVPREAHDSIVSTLATLDRDTLPAGDMAAIWNALRSVVSQHRRFPEAAWVLPDTYLKRIEGLQSRFEPADPIARTVWLFSHRAHLPRDCGEDFGAEDLALENVRSQAIVDVRENGGIAGLEAMIALVDEPSILGQAAGLSEGHEKDDGLLVRRHVASTDARSRQFGRGFVLGRALSRGVQWIRDSLQQSELTARQRAELLVCFPDRHEAWRIASSDPAIDAAYWTVVSPYVRGTRDDIEHVARKLIEHRRASAAVEMLSGHINDEEPPSSSLFIDALEAFIAYPGEEGLGSNFAYHVGEVLDALARSSDVDESRIARAEWALARVLDVHRPPVLLHRELSQSPRFFIELVSLVFKEEGSEPREVTPEGVRLAETAYSVLSTWRTPPGLSSDGVAIDALALNGWVDAALELANAAGRRTMAEQRIGHVLRYVPNGGDGLWPHECVRELLERLGNANVEQGLEIEVYNGRGVVSRDPLGGGSQERQLAAQYNGWAGLLKVRWPRTGDLLRRVADEYEREAHTEDREAELRKDGFW